MSARPAPAGRPAVATQCRAWLARCWAMRGRYVVAWLFLAIFLLAALITAVLPARADAALLWWASTDVANLRHDPAGCLIASAFLPDGGALTWVPLIALAAFGANRALGNARTLIVCTAGHVIGTLVSEGIVAYRISRALLPAADTRIMDVGPSYVVVSAIVAALLLGSWPARLAAAADLAILVGAGNIFGGLSTLQLAAVGHATAICVSVLLSPVLMRGVKRRQRERGAAGPVRAGVPAGEP